jgi:hypothetical protein
VPGRSAVYFLKSAGPRLSASIEVSDFVNLVHSTYADRGGDFVAGRCLPPSALDQQTPGFLGLFSILESKREQLAERQPIAAR